MTASLDMLPDAFVADLIEDDTREAWLGRAADAIATCEHLLGDYAVPPLRISVGWAGAGAPVATTAGQCWPTTSADDRINQIFISPSYGYQDTIVVLGVLTHEMIHAIDDCQSGHRGNFAVMAERCGFTAPLTHSGNMSERLLALLGGIAEELGPFPHSALDPLTRAADTAKPQKARQLKLVCSGDECGYTVRTTRKWLDVGLPWCPCGHEMMEEA